MLTEVSDADIYDNLPNRHSCAACGLLYADGGNGRDDKRKEDKWT